MCFASLLAQSNALNLNVQYLEPHVSNASSDDTTLREKNNSQAHI